MTMARCGLAIGALSAALATSSPAAASPSRIAEILVNASNGGVLYAEAPDAPRRPASLTKMMTLYLAFDAMEAGRLRPSDRIVMSRHAARQQPSKLGVAAGQSLSVRDALRAIAVLSANDVAVALAERLGGTEAQFARAMTRKAQALGMEHSRFENATGLTNGGNVTTARDMATLSRALLRHHPREYALFATRSLRWQSREIANHNHLLGRVNGVDGIKTGYTADAGYNLAASARRGGRRVIAVVLGERSIAARDVRVANLVQLGFSAPSRRMAGLGRLAVANSKPGHLNS